MGSCFSYVRTQSESASVPAAKVVSVTGDLREYNVPVYASQVLESEAYSSSSSSSSSSSNWFLCNSDRLYYDDYIPALDSSEELQANQIYFVLPNSKLEYRLTASDMAGLAVKASVALQNASQKDSNRRKKARISPVLLLNQPITSETQPAAKIKYFQSPAGPPPPGISRSASVRRLQRYTSRRAKMAVRSFRLRLSTIYEGTVL